MVFINRLRTVLPQCSGIDFVPDSFLIFAMMGALGRLGSIPFSRETDSQPAYTTARRKSTQTFKPAPPVTTEPPPRRLTLPDSSKPLTDRQHVRSPPLTTSLPIREATPSSDQTHVAPREGEDALQTSRLLPPTSGKLGRRIPPPLPPREESILESPSQCRPVLAIMDTPPTLPPRISPIANPPLPPRNYRNTSIPTIIPQLEFDKPPAKPPRRTSFSPSGGPQSNLSRLDSSSSTSSADSTATSASHVSSASSLSTAPSVAPKSPHIAELIKVLESKKAPSPPIRGVVQTRPLQ